MRMGIANSKFHSLLIVSTSLFHVAIGFGKQIYSQEARKQDIVLVDMRFLEEFVRFVV